MTSAHDRLREVLLSDGLEDWLPLAHLESTIARERLANSVGEEQNLALETIRSLASDGLFEIGDLSGNDAEFRAWDMSIDEAMQRICDAYVVHNDDRPGWVFLCWLGITDKGRTIALSHAG